MYANTIFYKKSSAVPIASRYTITLYTFTFITPNGDT